MGQGLGVRALSCCAFHFTDAARRFEAIHLRHLAIHENGGIGNVGDRFNSLQTIGDRIGAITQFLKHADRDPLIDRVVLGHENAAKILRAVTDNAGRRRISGAGVEAETAVGVASGMVVLFSVKKVCTQSDK